MPYLPSTCFKHPTFFHYFSNVTPNDLEIQSTSSLKFSMMTLCQDLSIWKKSDFLKYFLTCSFPTKGRCVCLFIRTNYTFSLIAADFHTFLEQCLNKLSSQLLSGSIFPSPFFLSVNVFINLTFSMSLPVTLVSTSCTFKLVQSNLTLFPLPAHLVVMCKIHEGHLT